MATREVKLIVAGTKDKGADDVWASKKGVTLSMDVVEGSAPTGDGTCGAGVATLKARKPSRVHASTEVAEEAKVVGREAGEGDEGIKARNVTTHCKSETR